MANSIFKSHVFLKNPREICLWPKSILPKNAALSSSRRFSNLPLLLHNHLHLHSSSLPLCHRLFLLRLHCVPLHRRRLPTHFVSMSSVTPSTDASATPAKTVRVLIKGRVQGVFYRNWTIDNATELGLKGWVRNRRNGSVEALFSGSPEKVQEMEQRCRRGPPDAMVTGLEVFPSTDDPGTKFERKPTV
ncbi:Acylphosphatase [Abeliophyllum distichum]|uniref:acylphosphatase n=1 Tax=Abeliophyllum distichum TaxID=126358 RepID=A0ABD1QYS8_9LAMI